MQQYNSENGAVFCEGMACMGSRSSYMYSGTLLAAGGQLDRSEGEAVPSMTEEQ